MEWWATDGPKLIKMLTESVAVEKGQVYDALLDLNKLIATAHRYKQ